MIAIDLKGKTILMTGALGAIAEHMVRRLGEAGATLVLTDIKPKRMPHSAYWTSGKFRECRIHILRRILRTRAASSA